MVIQGVGLIVMGEAGLIIIKLCYWILHSRLEIVREIKRLQLHQILAVQRPSEKTT